MVFAQNIKNTQAKRGFFMFVFGLFKQIATWWNEEETPSSHSQNLVGFISETVCKSCECYIDKKPVWTFTNAGFLSLHIIEL